MKIGFIGAGRMGTSLSIFFHKRCVTISGFYDIDTNKAHNAAASCQTSSLNSIHELCELCDTIFITTNDSAIEATCQQIASATLKDRKIVFHVSGLLDSSILASAAEAGYYTASLHPLQSVIGGDEGAKRLEHCLFTIEGNDASILAAEPLLKRCKIYPKRILSSQKAAYHAAASLVSNHFFSLIDCAVELLASADFNETEAVKALLPLIRGSIDNLESQGIKAAVTGPIVRGDIATTKKHLECLNEISPSNLDMFRTTGIKLACIANSADLIDTQTKEKIAIILEGGLQ